jgi:hypothetical protein
MCQNYWGQTGSNFLTRYKEHSLSYKHQNQNSKSSHHLQECRHSVGPIDEIMEVVYIVNKETVINIFEQFCIY